MAQEPPSAADVKEILKLNGIENIDQLANIIAAKSALNPVSDSINLVADSWVIKVWKLDNVASLPINLGGNILNKSAEK